MLNQKESYHRIVIRNENITHRHGTHEEISRYCWEGDPGAGSRQNSPLEGIPCPGAIPLRPGERVDV